MLRDLSELVNNSCPSSLHPNRGSQETNSQDDSNARARRDDEMKRLQTETARKVSERRREESLSDERDRSGLSTRSNSGSDAPQGYPCIPIDGGSANGESGLDDGIYFDEIKQAEHYRGDVTSRYGYAQDENEE